MNLYNSVFIFRTYLIVVILFLAPFCIFITLELIKIVFYYYIYFIKLSSSSNKALKIEDILSVFQYNLKKKKWLSCILMLEFFQELQERNYSNFLGICYQRISFNSIAEYYYLQALVHDSMNLNILHNLANIYSETGNQEDAIKIYKKIISIDPTDMVATKCLMN